MCLNVLVFPGITGMVSGEGPLGSVDNAGREYAHHADSQHGDMSTLKIVTFNIWEVVYLNCYNYS